MIYDAFTNYTCSNKYTLYNQQKYITNNNNSTKSTLINMINK